MDGLLLRDPDRLVEMIAAAVLSVVDGDLTLEGPG